MFPVTYEDVVLRDRPICWWRPTVSGTWASAVGGSPGSTMAPSGSGANLPYGGPGLPGAFSNAGSSHTLGTTNSTGQGWTTGDHTLPNGPLTFEVWFWLDAAPAAASNVIGRYNTLTSGAGRITYSLTIGTDLALTYRPANSSLTYPAGTAALGRWNHLVWLANYTHAVSGSNWNTIYLDGRLAGSQVAGSVDTSSGFKTHLGISGLARGTGTNLRSFPGFLAEPAIYQHPLTPQQIHDHYTAGLGGRRHSARLASIMTQPAVAPSPPPPGGLTIINTPLVNRRVAVVSDRPR